MLGGLRKRVRESLGGKRGNRMTAIASFVTALSPFHPPLRRQRRLVGSGEKSGSASLPTVKQPPLCVCRSGFFFFASRVPLPRLGAERVFSRAASAFVTKQSPGCISRQEVQTKPKREAHDEAELAFLLLSPLLIDLFYLWLLLSFTVAPPVAKEAEQPSLP